MSTPAVEEILRQLPISRLSAQLGVDDQTVTRAAAAAIPSLIGGLAHNAGQGQEQPIADALAQHRSAGLLDSDQVDLARVDTEDGAKIVQHIFGDQSTQLGHAIGQRTSTSGDLVNKLLPVLAPVVLAYAGKKVGGSQGANAGMLGNALGSILSQGRATTADSTTSSADTAPEESVPAPEERPRSGGSIVDEVLSGLFGKH